MTRLVAVALEAFDDPCFAAPTVSVGEGRKHPWLEMTGDGVSATSDAVLQPPECA